MMTRHDDDAIVVGGGSDNDCKMAFVSPIFSFLMMIIAMIFTVAVIINYDDDLMPWLWVMAEIMIARWPLSLLSSRS